MRYFKYLVLLMLFSKASSYAQVSNSVSPWSGERYSEVLTDASRGLRFSFDNQLNKRNVIHFMKYIDWSKFKRVVDQSSVIHEGQILSYQVIEDVGEDYISSQEVLDSIRDLDYDLYLNLISGLNLDRLTLIDSSDQDEEDSAVVSEDNLAEDFDISNLRLSSQGLILEEPAWRQEEGASSLLQRGLIEVEERDFTNLGIVRSGQENLGRVNDWKLLNNRWNSLSSYEKQAVFQYHHLSLKQKAKLFSLVYLMNALELGLSSNVSVFDFLGNDLQQAYNNLHLKTESSKSGDEYIYALEASLKEPMQNPVEFLNFYYTFNKEANRLYYLLNPLGRQGFSDGDYHLHISDETREEEFEPIVKAWNNMIALHEVRSGNLNWYNDDSVSRATYIFDVRRKGFVKLIDERYVELRTHVFNPEESLTHFVQLLSMDNIEAVEHIYTHLIPENITKEELFSVAAKASALYADLLKTPSFMQRLSFLIDEDFNSRIYSFLEAKLSNAEPVDLKDYSFLSPDMKSALAQDYAKAISRLSREEALEVIASTILVNDELVHNLDLEILLDYLDSYLGFYDEMSFSFSTHPGLFFRNRGKIAAWYIKRSIGPNEDPRRHGEFLEDFIRGAELHENSHEGADDSNVYLFENLSPNQFSFILRHRVLMNVEIEEMVRSYNKEFVAIAIRELFSFKPLFRHSFKNNPLLKNIEVWLGVSDQVRNAYFQELKSQELNMIEEANYLSYLVQNELFEQKERYLQIKADYKSFEENPQRNATDGNYNAFQEELFSCKSILN